MCCASILYSVGCDVWVVPLVAEMKGILSKWFPARPVWWHAHGGSSQTIAVCSLVSGPKVFLQKHSIFVFYIVYASYNTFFAKELRCKNANVASPQLQIDVLVQIAERGGANPACGFHTTQLSYILVFQMLVFSHS